LADVMMSRGLDETSCPSRRFRRRPWSSRRWSRSSTLFRTLKVLKRRESASVWGGLRRRWHHVSISRDASGFGPTWFWDGIQDRSNSPVPGWL